MPQPSVRFPAKYHFGRALKHAKSVQRPTSGIAAGSHVLG